MFCNPVAVVADQWP